MSSNVKKDLGHMMQPHYCGMRSPLVMTSGRSAAVSADGVHATGRSLFTHPPSRSLIFLPRAVTMVRRHASEYAWAKREGTGEEVSLLSV